MTQAEHFAAYISSRKRVIAGGVTLEISPQTTRHTGRVCRPPCEGITLTESSCLPSSVATSAASCALAAGVRALRGMSTTLSSPGCLSSERALLGQSADQHVQPRRYLRATHTAGQVRLPPPCARTHATDDVVARRLSTAAAGAAAGDDFYPI